MPNSDLLPSLLYKINENQLALEAVILELTNWVEARDSPRSLPWGDPPNKSEYATSHAPAIERVFFCLEKSYACYRKRPRHPRARIAADQVIDGKVPDPTDGATHYYAITMKTAPAWAAKAIQTLKLGGQAC